MQNPIGGGGERNGTKIGLSRWPAFSVVVVDQHGTAAGGCAGVNVAPSVADEKAVRQVDSMAPGGVEELRKRAGGALASKSHVVIVNFSRKALGQQTYGHISPLGAYDGKADRFLILDVARYKYPPVWVKTSDVFAAMNTEDAANDNKTRGFVLVTAATVH